MNREIDKTMSADWIRSEANVWKGICVKSDMGIGLVKGLGGERPLGSDSSHHETTSRWILEVPLCK